MLEVSLAQKLIEQITGYTSYNVNIMNGDGIIIASRDAERVGTFHEPAWQILHGAEDMITVESENDYPGVSRGINMVIAIDGKREGVVGVTGEPEEIRPIALIIKMAIEAMIKYENQHLRSLRRQTKKDRLMSLMIQDPNADPAYIRSLANELNYSENTVRIPLLFCLEKDGISRKLLAQIKESSAHKNEDISFLPDERHILVFKSLGKEDTDIISSYKLTVRTYLESLLKYMERNNVRCRIFAGTFQSSFSQYCHAYRHCCWMEKALRTERTRTVSFFYDHIREYVTQCIPQKELQQIFNVFGRVFSEGFKENYSELIGSLIASNFNIAEASKDAFMHKNTFIYQYNKIRDMLDVNPQNSASDKWFLLCLCLFFSRQS